jgi:SAM-dependent methyltransferase
MTDFHYRTKSDERMSTDNITISDLEIMSNATNYRNWMYRRIAPFIGQRVLEIGAGIGNFTELLLDRELVVATDKYGPCVDYFRARLGKQLSAEPIQMDIAAWDDQADQRLIDYGLDTVICLNVLEHVEDDLSALANMYRILRPGGRLILLVPAFQFLFGSVDRSLEHHRRYTRKTLLPRIIQAGFRLETAYHMNVIGIAGWFLNNRVIKRKEESSDQIKFFDQFIAPWAEQLEKVLPPPIGLSIIAIGIRE